MNHTTDPTLETLIVETATALGMDNPSEQMLLEFTTINTGTSSNNVIPFQQSSHNSRKADGLTRISGVFIHNDPARFEPGALADAVEAFQNQIRSKQALGTLRGSEFKASPVVDPATAAIVIEKLELNKEGHAIGVCAVCSKKLEALLRISWIPTVMVRGLGRINEKTRQTRKGFRLTALDVGWTGRGSAVTATLGSDFSIHEQATSKTSTTRLTEQQQHEPAAEPVATKQRLISPELIAEKFDNKRRVNDRMAQWISSVRNNTDFK
ncbi:hypothetical protein [Shewanella algae]|uniref:Prohead core protein protease n=1 Tax=Shewanella algae TaxID=38313 RepID=A0A379YJQ5_9GAMM|nr:hypothetical protein [Shewanella algae]MBO2606942.1 hypothetical protein [Shewanella algae]SUI46227.1 Prohead core protein protease [Shewanella algae]